MMKTALIASLLTVASTAYAQEPVTAYIQDHFRTVNRSVPMSREVCQDVEVRSRSNGGSPNGGAVILGGIVGNAIGAASGITDGRTLGTVIGGIAGAEMSRDSGGSEYRTERRCRVETEYSVERSTQYTYSTATFTVDGRTYTVNFTK